MAWPLADRHPEAAYRTHQEAGARDGIGRVALTALCAVARGEKVDCPDGIDTDAWDMAKARVKGRKSRKFAVTANDVRVAKKAKLNIPEPAEDFGSVVDILSKIASATQYIRSLRQVSPDLVIDADARAALIKALTGHIDESSMALAVFEGFSDEGLAEMLAKDGEA